MAPQRAKSQENLDLATNVTDKEERKRQRRLRVERAIAAQDKDGMETANDDGDKEECSLSQQQVVLDKERGQRISSINLHNYSHQVSYGMRLEAKCEEHWARRVL